MQQISFGEINYIAKQFVCEKQKALRATALNSDHIHPNSQHLWKNYAYGACGWTETMQRWALPRCLPTAQARGVHRRLGARHTHQRINQGVGISSSSRTDPIKPYWVTSSLHCSRRRSPNRSAATARSPLAWLGKHSINKSTKGFQANGILNAGTHLSLQSILFHSGAVNVTFGYIQSSFFSSFKLITFCKILSFNIFLL